MKVISFYKSLLFIFLLLLLSAFSYLNDLDYKTIVGFYQNKHQSIFQIDQFQNLFFTKNQFLIFKINILLFTILLFLLIVAMLFFEKFFLFYFIKFKNESIELLKKFFSIFKKLDRIQLVILISILIILTSIKIYFSVQKPPHIDEVFSYTMFVDHGFLVTCTYYPYPNNHVLNNLFCCCFKILGFSPIWAMRLPSLLFWFTSVVLLFAYFSQKSSFYIAIFSVLIFGTVTFLPFFSFMGRGYQLTLLCFVASFIVSDLYWCSFRSSFLLINIIINALGFWAIPSYMYCMVFLAIFNLHQLYLKGSFADLKKTLISLLILFLLIFILYLPLISISGFDHIFNNQYTIEQKYSWLVVEYLYFLKPLMLFVVLMMFLFLIKNKILIVDKYLSKPEMKQALAISIYTILTFLAFQIINYRTPPERTMIWVSYIKYLVLLLFISILLNLFSKKLQKLFFVCVSIILTLVGLIRNQNQLDNCCYDGNSKLSEQKVNLIHKTSEISPKSIETNSLDFYAYWLFLNPEQKNIIKMKEDDNLKSGSEILVQYAKNKIPAGYKPIFSNPNLDLIVIKQ